MTFILQKLSLVNPLTCSSLCGIFYVLVHLQKHCILRVIDLLIPNLIIHGVKLGASDWFTCVKWGIWRGRRECCEARGWQSKISALGVSLLLWVNGAGCHMCCYQQSMTASSISLFYHLCKQKALWTINGWRPNMAKQLLSFLLILVSFISFRLSDWGDQKGKHTLSTLTPRTDPNLFSFAGLSFNNVCHKLRDIRFSSRGFFLNSVFF